MSKILYNGEFYNIVPTLRSSQTHYLVEGGKKILKEQAILCEHSENDIVKYGENDEYYGKIVEKEPIYKNGKIKYFVRNLLDDEPKNVGSIIEEEEDKTKKEICQTDIIKILKSEWQDIITAAKHTCQYNRMVKKSPIQLNFVIDVLKGILKLRSNLLTELSLRNKITKNDSFIAENILLNPYSFIQEEWQLFNYNKALMIENTLNLEIQPHIKCIAWIYSLIHSRNSLYYPEDEFEKNYEEAQFTIYKSAKVITKQALIEEEILVLKQIDGKRYITTPYLLKYEKSLGDTMISLYHEMPFQERIISDEEIEYYIRMFENDGDNRTILKENQRIAVKKAFKYQFVVITGFPGTGKTTILECIIFIRNELGLSKNISLSAPTGLAYNNMHRKLKKYELNTSASGTLHKVVFSSFPHINKKNKDADSSLSETSSNDDDMENEEKMETVNINITDEVSMMDIFMFKHLLDWAKKFNFQLIIAGDKNQLQSVGPGKVLHSIIDSGLFNENIVTLTEICRQGDGALLAAIKKMASGLTVRKSDFDNESLLFRLSRYFKKDKSLDSEKVLNLIDNYGLTKDNTKFLCYNSDVNKPINVTTLNGILQKKYNDSEEVIKCSSDRPIAYKIGDHIILKTNEIQTSKRKIRVWDRETEVYVEEYEYTDVYRANGDEAVILSQDEEKKTVNIFYKYNDDDGETTLQVNELYNSYDLSYALSVHKSQGSQCQNIVFMMDNTYNLNRPVIFTAISRAQEQCFVICNDEIDFVSVQRNQEEKVSLFLQEFIETEFEFI
jgi:ATP-dependent exoDNAse (exonuclease V) alpha subunit